jgi:outer membrane protein OmpA-like peptidoglycan-associated protein
MRIHRLLGLLVCIGAASLAHAKMPAEDTVKGAKDHPLLSRFEGSKMVAYEVKEFDETSLPASKRGYRREPQGYYFEKTLDLEGKVTRIAYLVPRERSSLEVLRNYQMALEKAGLKILYTCAKEACGESPGDYWLRAKLDRNFLKSSDADSAFRYGSREPRYLVASGTRPDGSPLHVAVYVVTPKQDYEGGAYVEIVEGKPMETGKVATNMNAAEMAKNIAVDGKVAVYGVYFDTGKAEVKPDSKPALDEMAKLLQQDPKLKVFVVGHTDNQGELAQNLSLSQKRAESVVKSLAEGYKVDPRRLSPKGVASYAPLASNREDAGRQKNRRVELVEQ